MKKIFSEKNIIKIIAQTRAKKTLLRGEYLFYRNISKSAPIINRKFAVDYLCPPRKEWVRLDKKERNRLSPIKAIELSIYKTILYKYKKIDEGSKQWVINLKKFIIDIQNEIFVTKSFSFSEPKIIPEIKDESKASYRPIASFNLKEKVIASLTSKYLSIIFEKIWETTDCAYAFRNSKKTITHHSAVNDIVEFKKKYSALYAAECDIKKFYDSVNHQIAIEIFKFYCNQLSESGVIVDNEAKKILISYFECYTFEKTVLDKSEIWLSEQKITSPNAHFETLDGLTSYDNIGVPQGGALSCFIANLILHSTDLTLKEEKDPDLFYARYCDDMVLMHPNKDKCLFYLNRYIDGLKKLKLFHHEPELIDSYNSSFWSSKSKLPYFWGDSSLGNNTVPWLSFVGYQIRYDGLMRVRPKSIKKEKEKQVKVIDQALKCLKIKNKKKAEANLRIKTKQVIYRVRKKLLAMSIGAISEEQLINGNKFCWVEGFKFLKKQNFVQAQIKSLDKNRVKQIHRLQRHLKLLKDPQIKKVSESIPFEKFDSYKMSYYKQFK